MGPLGILGAILTGGSLLGSALQRFSPRYRRAERDAERLGQWRQEAALASLKDDMKTQREDTARGRSMIKQSMFARGLGKSSIASQEMGRFNRERARQWAALKRAKKTGDYSLGLIKSRRKLARQSNILNLAGQAGGALSFGAGLFGGSGGSSSGSSLSYREPSAGGYA